MKRFKFEDGFFFWLGIILITLSLIVIQDNYKWLSIYPKELIIPFDNWLNAGMGSFDYLFRLVLHGYVMAP